MAVNPDIHDRAYQFFIEEVPELLQAIERGILELRQDRSANIVHEVMRAAHSIKGGAASVELEAIKCIAHRLETAFRALYDATVEIDVELESLLLQGYDCLQQPLQEQMDTGRHDAEQALAIATPVLEAIEAKLGAEALSHADSYIPSSSDLGVDMVVSIFEIDVEEGIARLEEVAANPTAFPVAGELQTQAEVFAGFGELLELPGFGAIAQAVMDALDHHPTQATEILHLALVDLKAARDLVMGGDRDQGGAPSAALLALAQGAGAGRDGQDRTMELEAMMSVSNSLADTGEAIDDADDFSFSDADFGEPLDGDGFSFEMDDSAFGELLNSANALQSVLSGERGIEEEPSADPFSQGLGEGLGGGLSEAFDEEFAAEDESQKVEDVWEDDPWAPPSTVAEETTEGGIDFDAIFGRIAEEEDFGESGVESGAEPIPQVTAEPISEAVELTPDAILEPISEPIIEASTTASPIASQDLSDTTPTADLNNLLDAFDFSAVDGTHDPSEELVSEPTVEPKIFEQTWIQQIDEGTFIQSERFDSVPIDALDNDLNEAEVHATELQTAESEAAGSEAIAPSPKSQDHLLALGDLAAFIPPAEINSDEINPYETAQVLSWLSEDSSESDFGESDFGESDFGESDPNAPVEADSASSATSPFIPPFAEEPDLKAAEAALFGIPSPTPSNSLTDAAVQVALAELHAQQPEGFDPSTEGTNVVGSPTPSAVDPALESIMELVAESALESATESGTESTTASTLESVMESAMKSVEEMFDQLPAIAELPETMLAPQAAAAASADPAESSAESDKPDAKSKSQRSGAPLSGISVRVDLGVLERMNNLVGELILSRNSASLQHEQLQTVVGQLAKRFKTFESLIDGLRSVADQMLVKPGSVNSAPTAATPAASLASLLNNGLNNGDEAAEGTFLDGFDALEMDRYSDLHGQLQSVFEELMQLQEGVDDIDVLLEQSTQNLTQQRQRLSRLQNELMWARMLPLDDILSRFPRVLRDLSAKHGKAVDLKLEGTHVLVDKGVLEKLNDPMLHLLRNAFDHGIETPESRKTQGKAERGTIAIRAYYQGNQTVIEINDDGRGLNLDKIARRALELGWLSREELKTIPQQVVADLIFEPGFSTADQVSDLSGRGVGLDVVRDQLKSLKGSVSVSSKPGQGTTFKLSLPVTLSVAKLMVCQVGPLAIALPSDAIEDLLVPEPRKIKMVANQRFLHWRDDLISIHALSEMLEYNCPLPDATSLKSLTDSTIPVPQDWAMPLLIFSRNNQCFALEVNRLLMEQELVVKPFGPAVSPPPYAYGCTILGDGRMIPVLDSVALYNAIQGNPQETLSGVGIELGGDAVEAKAAPTAIPMAPVAIAPPPMSTVSTMQMAKTILVVDDSTAMRRTLALSLEKAGYRVVQAGDGQEALEQLRQSNAIQLVICDVEMPNMNGFEFLSQRRREPQLLGTPVVMLTSRSSDKHRRLALQLNADGYFSKPYVEQEFLKAIQGILETTPTAITL